MAHKSFRRHPAHVTVDRLAAHYERYALEPSEQSAFEEVMRVLNEIADGVRGESR
jgi:hypothetical protein